MNTKNGMSKCSRSQPYTWIGASLKSKTEESKLRKEGTTWSKPDRPWGCWCFQRTGFIKSITFLSISSLGQILATQRKKDPRRNRAKSVRCPAQWRMHKPAQWWYQPAPHVCIQENHHLWTGLSCSPAPQGQRGLIQGQHLISFRHARYFER